MGTPAESSNRLPSDDTLEPPAGITTRMLQLGVVGSMADVHLEPHAKHVAEVVGQEIASAGAVLLYRYEGDSESLPCIAGNSAAKARGDTVAFLWGSGCKFDGAIPSLRVVTGQQRGGGREFSFIFSCDAVISIGGGSGTLVEITIAYQAGIPVVSLSKSGGWSERLAGRFIDGRKRQIILAAIDAKEAVRIAIAAAHRRLAQVRG